MKSLPLRIARPLAVSVLAALCTTHAAAGEVAKANNTDALNLTSSWSLGTAPTATDVALWDATVTAANTVLLGADTSWQGIKLTSPGGAVTISAGNILTLGSSGIDLSSATQNLSIAAPIVLGANQTWSVGTGRTLSILGGVTNSTSTLTKSGAGVLFLDNVGTNGTLTSINLTGGQVTFKGVGAGGTAAAITAADGTTIHMDNVTTSTSTFISNAISVVSGATVTHTSDSAGNGYSGAVSGDATSTYIIGVNQQVGFSATNTQQFGSFLGTVRVNSGAGIRFSTSSTLNNGGTNTTFDVLGNMTTRGGGTVHLGTLTGSGTITGPGGADGTATYSIGAKGVNSEFSGAISDNTSVRRVAVTKTGSGILTLSGTNTYTGATAVNAGTLLVNGSLGATVVTVGASGTLGGTGTIGGATTVNGSLAPGASPGVLTFSSTLTLAGTTNLELNGSTRGTTYDGINVAGALTYGGTLNVTFGSSFLAGGESFSLFTAADGTSIPASVTGSFASINLLGGYTGSLTNNSGVWTGTIGGVDFTFTQSTGLLTTALSGSPVPEPSTYAALAGLAVLGFVATRRRRA